MSEKLERAIASIKSGNNQLGQQLLAQILRQEPKNELAWLWMSAVVDVDKRKYCIERVLAINPNNKVARQALENLLPAVADQKEIILQANSQYHVQSPKEYRLGKLEEEKNNSSTTKIILKGSISIGVIWGILGLPALFVLTVINLFIPPIITIVLFFLIFTSVGIPTGIYLFREGISSFTSVSMGGAISGFVAGAILNLIGAAIINTVYGSTLPPVSYLLYCGVIIPAVIGIINAVSVWIPRIFINPNDPNKPFSVTKITSYFIKDNPKSGLSSSDLSVSEEFLRTLTDKQKYWISPDNSTICLFLESALIYGEISTKTNMQVQALINKGNLPLEFLNNKAEILYSNINTATKIKSILKIKHTKNNKDEVLDLDCHNDTATKEILDALHEKLGANFEKTTLPASIKDVIIVPVVLFFIVITFSTLLYYLLSSLTVNQVADIIGKEYTSQIISFLRFFLQGGIFAISASLLIIITGVIVSRIIKLPEITKLTAKESAAERLQRAIRHIKSGEIQQGHSLLTQVVKTDPDNEEAWIWIASIVDNNHKPQYLDQVLRINPSNQQALDAVKKINQIKAANSLTNVPIKQSTSISHIQNTSLSKPAPMPIQFWINSTRKGTHVLVASEQKLFTAKCESNLAAQVDSQLTRGHIPTELLTEKITIEYDSLIQVVEVGISLEIHFFDKTQRKEKIRIECKDKEMQQTILNSLEEILEKSFERLAAPMKKREILAGNGILILIVSTVSTLLYFAALEIESGNISATGSARTRGIINLLDLLGPNSIIWIGGGLLLILIYITSSMLNNPPVINKITRKASLGINNEPEATTHRSTLEDTHNELIDLPIKAAPGRHSSLLGAALSDGLMAGLIGGIIGIVFPALYLFTQDTLYFGIGTFVDVAVLLLTGVATGILFYRRKLPRGSKVVGVGGGIGGAIAGAICGTMTGFAISSDLSEAGMGSNSENYFLFFLILFCIMPAILGAVLGALTAWIPGIFIKSDPNVRPFDWKEGKTDLEIARVEAAQSKAKKSLKNRLIMIGVYVAIFLFIFICRSFI